MGLDTELTEYERGYIIGAHVNGASGAVIGSQLGRSKSAVNKLVKMYKETGTVDVKPRSGRPKKLTDQDEDNIIKKIKKNRQTTAQEIADYLNLQVSISTIKRALHRKGYYGRVAAKKPFITAENAMKRLEWCKQHATLTGEDWKKFIWSDESSVEIGRQSRQIKVWRRHKERFKKHCLLPTFKSGRTSVSIWAAFIGDQKSEIAIRMPPTKRKKKNDENDETDVGVGGRLNADGYINILDKYLLDIIKKGTNKMSKKDKAKIKFVQDGARIHTAKKTLKWLEDQQISVMDWPAQSPDLNPIENLWKILKDQVNRRRPRPMNAEAMAEALRDEWDEIEGDLLLRLCESMPNRIQLVIANRGYPCRY